MSIMQTKIEEVEKEIEKNESEVEEILNIVCGGSNLSGIECPNCKVDIDIADLVKHSNDKTKLSLLQELEPLVLDKKEVEKKIEKFLKERTYQTNELPPLVKFLPFEVEELKSSLGIK